MCLYEDGTVVTEEYFQHLPDNTELVLLPEGQSWNGREFISLTDSWDETGKHIVIV